MDARCFLDIDRTVTLGNLQVGNNLISVPEPFDHPVNFPFIAAIAGEFGEKPHRFINRISAAIAAYEAGRESTDAG
jgi:hypothetical protein